ncbi:hypothetical protein ACQ86N_35525 [Puia sp. P3]|uniref:hypothetical protein n=1 Tax=Puia sp. P3 TaxID=3423952 RepID=UPI003D6665FB
MFENYSFTVAERFLRYVQIDTQSDPQSTTYPSTEKQKDLGRLLVQELQAAGLSDADMDEFGYVYATLPANTDKPVPVICYCAHMDTSSDSSGTGVKPIVHHAYNGGISFCRMTPVRSSLRRSIRIWRRGWGTTSSPRVVRPFWGPTIRRGLP